MGYATFIFFIMFTVCLHIFWSRFIIFAGESVPSLTGREIDGTYLDQNKEDIEKEFEKFKL